MSAVDQLLRDAAEHHKSGKLPAAMEAYRQAVALRPNDPSIYAAVGKIQQTARRFDLAIAAYRKALELRPNDADVALNLANVLKGMGQIEEALHLYDRAIMFDPQNVATHSAKLQTLYYHEGFDGKAILREHREWNRRHAAGITPLVSHYSNDRMTDRRLRIGYVSPDFRGHCQSLFTLPVLGNHRRASCQIFCYSISSAEDAVTARLRGHADEWRDISGVSDQHAAETILKDRIDVLVDLTMHMHANRLRIFAYKPAPVQVTWLAYPGTTGLDRMDYRLTDPYIDPADGKNDVDYAEKSVRLPRSFWCFDPQSERPEVQPAPAMSNGYVTFGSLNSFCKMNNATLVRWAGVLVTVPRSRLLMLAPEGSARQWVQGIMASQGIDPARIEFVDMQPRRLYLQTFHRIDIGLDTLPYNGHTTSLDSLWMGVPVITRVGTTAAGRAGWCQCCNLGMRELAAWSDDQFVHIAASLAGDLQRLQTVRAVLRTRLRRSPLMDAARFVEQLEDAYRSMWRHWCGSKT